MATSNGRQLYDTLGVHENAQEEEIKRAFRKLALQYHPDKTAGLESKFQEVNRAYEILSNKNTRKIYDRYGEIGLTIYSTVKSDTMVDILLNTRRLKAMFLVFLMVLILLGLFPSMVALKVSRIIHWDWNVIFLPLWVLDIFVLLIGTSLLYLSWKTIDGSDEEQMMNLTDEDAGKLNKAAFIIGTVVLSIVLGVVLIQQLLLSLRLERTIVWSWWIVLSPLLAYESIRFLLELVFILYVGKKWEKTPAGGNSDNSYPFAYLLFKRLRWSSMRLSFIILLLCKLSVGRNLSWSLVWCPIYLLTIPSLLIDYKFDQAKARQVAIDENGVTDQEPLLLIYLIYGFMVIYVNLTVGLINARLMNYIGTWTISLLPIYFMSLIMEIIVVIGGVIIYHTLIPNFYSLPSTSTGTEMSRLWKYGYALGPFQQLISNT